MKPNNKDSVDLVFLLGNSRSGSTLLGFLLGSSEKVVDAGELKLFNQSRERNTRCSCGKRFWECPFWSNIAAEKSYSDVSVAEKVSVALKILAGRVFDTHRSADEFELLRKILAREKQQNSKIGSVLDASKSLWNLVRWIQDERVNVKIVLMRRGIYGNVSSFVKHGKGLLMGIIKYKLNNFLIRRLFAGNDYDYCTVEYRDLVQNTQEVLDRVGEFIDADYSDYEQRVNEREYHVPSGSRRTLRQFQEGFEGLEYDDSWKERLTPLQKKIISLVA